ncbi:hypothetical protein B0H16DRAFT_1456200 [Mycena metata]|uniref:Uncharacterized protein n=1 Tax=Mycena metata TaxID=1033252 RepID=A0AAD7JB27_9AGAR|nr:hypothetical protein B0H16DRAFT_1456200 [Mycena metata]
MLTNKELGKTPSTDRNLFLRVGRRHKSPEFEANFSSPEFRQYWVYWRNIGEILVEILGCHYFDNTTRIGGISARVLDLANFWRSGRLHNITSCFLPPWRDDAAAIAAQPLPQFSPNFAILLFHPLPCPGPVFWPILSQMRARQTVPNCDQRYPAQSWRKGSSTNIHRQRHESARRTLGFSRTAPAAHEYGASREMNVQFMHEQPMPPLTLSPSLEAPSLRPPPGSNERGAPGFALCVPVLRFESSAPLFVLQERERAYRRDIGDQFFGSNSGPNPESNEDLSCKLALLSLESLVRALISSRPTVAIMSAMGSSRMKSGLDGGQRRIRRDVDKRERLASWQQEVNGGRQRTAGRKVGIKPEAIGFI